MELWPGTDVLEFIENIARCMMKYFDFKFDLQ